MPPSPIAPAPRAAVVGVSGLSLTPDEATLFATHPPLGVILFGRNVADPSQLAALIAAIRVVLPGALLMVDQEGGRVARLRPPHWQAHPPAAAIGALHGANAAAGLRAAWITGALIGHDCAAAGFDVACAPVLDLRHPGMTDAIGDRAFGTDPEAVAALGRAMAEGLLAAGIQPVGKHAPGHGRAVVDSHQAMPCIDAADLDADFLPFIRNADLPWMMTAHLLYEALDQTHPATLSPGIIATVIRGRIGFDGVLVSDDLAMGALTGPPAERALACLAAGCDVALYCAGVFDHTEAVLRALPSLGTRTAARLAAAASLARTCKKALDPAALADERARLIAAG
jgi:beta-N-acetylhexosaminidase